MKKRAWLLSLLLLGLTAFTIVNHINHPSISAGATNTHIGAKAPSLFSLSQLTPTQLRDIIPGKGGKPMLLNFWASWCEPCKSEMPVLEQLYAQYRDQVDIITVNLTGKDRLTEVNRFIAENRLTLPVLLDHTMAATESYRIVQVPTTYFIDRKGFIAHRVLGPVTEHSLQEEIRKLLP
ncbi:TlpA family protein disulfide reductase [Paenibacillus koleovorans]|uniref:TlpA family protein disulfide reductase n=1 Tax=Paenibacillus koleovorans TaxID=121608 RepID=UPI000FD77C0C|nr:TlpA disulfide reductase family protein [Paenibacillus koleovorans]